MVLATAATVIGLAPSASAAYAVEPVGPSWVPNGGVHAVVVDAAANRVYVGGAFTGNVAALDASTGALLWNGNANGDVRALALGPNGSLLLGGAFTTVGGSTHRKIASVNAATGAVNNGFNGAAGGTVRDIVVVGTNAYFGGAFTNHGGMTQQGLGAVNASTGANVTGFTIPANGTVYALGTDGSRLFIGGMFTTLGGQARNALGSITLSTNTVDAWAPARACTGCNVIWDLTLDNPRNRVYTVGRNGGTLFTVDKTTGAELFRATGGVNGDSQAVTLAPDGRVYVGGHFVTVARQTRMLVAEFDVSGTRAVLGPFSTRFVKSYPGVWALASTSSRLYVGGDFTAAGSQVNGRNVYPYFAMFPSATAAGDTTAPTATGSPASGATSVPAATNVTATFNESVQGVDGTTFGLRQAGSTTDVPAAVAYDATTRVATLDPTADLAPSTQYTATLTGGTAAIRDMANNPLTTVSWSFTTGSGAADTTSPTSTGRIPAKDGAAGVGRTANVTVAFSETVTNVDTTTFTLRPAAGGTNVVAAVSFNSSNGRWVLNPNAALTANTAYTAKVDSTITDLAGNPFAGMSWSFTTGA